MRRFANWLDKNTGLKIAVFCIVVTPLFLYSFFYFGSRYEYRSRTWDDRTEIQLNDKKPEKSIYSRIGCPEAGCEPGYAFGANELDTAVLVYMSSDEFLKSYEKMASDEKKDNDADYVKSLSIIKAMLATDDEVSFKDIEIAIETETGTNSYIFDRNSRDVLADMMREGDVTIFEASEPDKVIEYIIFRDQGFLCGPLCGRGTYDYLLPNGKVFQSSFWIS